VARAFRSDAIVSLQFRPQPPRWIYTVVVRADNKAPAIIVGNTVLPARQHRGDNIFFYPSPSLHG